MDYAAMKEMYAGNRGSDFYEELLAEYDQMIDWESRLERETPLFRKLIAEYRVNSVLDAGCGTGRHCFHFRSLGVDKVIGADASAKAIEVARHRAEATGNDVHFIQSSFTELTDRASGSFDLITCLGNSISHLLTYDDLELTLNNFRRLLSPRGIILIHTLNWEKRLSNRERFIPPKSHPMPEGDKIFFRFFDFHDELVTMNLVIFEKGGFPEKKWIHRVHSNTLRPWRPEILRMALGDAGLTAVNEYGDPESSSYNPAASPDYLLIARKT